MTDERRAFVDALRDFAKREGGSREQRRALTDDDTNHHNVELIHKLAALGYVGCGLPTEYGGGGGTVVDVCLLMEETSYGMLPVIGLSTTLIVADICRAFGTEGHRDEVVRGACEGKTYAISMSEPEAGSDVANLRCRARREGDEYVIDGQKTWCSLAGVADEILLVCRTANGPRKNDGMTMLRVPSNTVGVELRAIPTLAGPHEVFDVFLSDVRVPAENVVGVEGQAWAQLVAGLNYERTVGGAMSLGWARRAFDDLLAYVSERRQFGKPIGSFQVNKHRLADLATELECCRLLVYEVAQAIEADLRGVSAREASMVKLKVTETFKQITIAGHQMMGGYGYSLEFDMQRHLRNGLLATIGGGTSEIQREIIGGSYGL
jgi:alkylation response protein AidB-like acyl-CoA dehydrogenase